MTKYGVILPIAGSVYHVVEAESPEEAIEAALELDHGSSDDLTWEVYHKLMSGNVSHFPVNEAEAEEL
jgi:hypothetical protein